MPEQPEQIVVRFRGEGSGEADLTWGQRGSWSSMVFGGTTEWTGGTMPLEPGRTVEGITHLLDFLMTRHQGMRTTFRRDPDGPKQIVHDHGEITLEVYDAADDEDPAEVAQTVRERYEAAPFDYTKDWPVRMAVIRHRGVASYFVALYTHLVMDGYGFDALALDLKKLDYATGAHLAPPAGVQPLELARLQKEPAMRRQSEANLRHWEQNLRAITPKRFGESGDPRDPRYWEATYRSRAIHLALPAIAERTKVHNSAVLLAAYAVILARLSGIPTSVIRTLASNRVRPGFAEAVTPVMQSYLCVIDTADKTFDEVIARAFKCQLAAGKYSYYDPIGLWDIQDAIDEERGERADLSVYYNDRRRANARGPAGPIVPEAEVRAALAESTLRWGPKSNDPDAICYLHINAAEGVAELELRADTHAVSPPALEGALRAIEELIVTAAFDPTVTTGVRSEAAVG